MSAMTTENPLELPAGRELDALVAEKIFGEQLSAETPAAIGRAVMSGFFSSSPKRDGPTEYGVKWNGTEYRLTLDESCWNYGGAQGNDGYGLWWWEHREGEPWQADVEAHVAKWRRSVPAYSTQIGAAWQVVEKLETATPTTLVQVTRKKAAECDDRMMYEVEFRQCEKPWGIVTAFAESAPLAICRAALKSVGVPSQSPAVAGPRAPADR